MPARCTAAFGALLFLASCGSSNKETPRFTVPSGFQVETAAPGSLTGSLVAFTFDSFGRPVVSKERGSPTILLDKDGDGIFETQKTFTDKVQSCQGLWFEARTLYATCDNLDRQAGLYKFEDTNGDDVADTFETVNTFAGRMQEHGPHEIRRGPDGYPTVILGNHTSIPENLVDPDSPLQRYRESQLLPRYMDARGHAAGILAPGGIVARLDRSSGKYSVLYGGFRNAYSHAYNLDGEPFIFDSDMEWDINMPWYREVRTVHGIPGADYGWRTGSGKFPAYYLDSLPPVRDAGRGSPVGVEFYQHHVYPESFRDAFFEGDWSRGRILVTRFVRSGATYRADPAEPREFVHGEPLNVTDLEVGPDGFLYFTTGGRDTEGGFYRVRYSPSLWSRIFPRRGGGVKDVVRQPQPLSSWGHAAQVKARQEMGGNWASDLERLARDASADYMDRIQALLVLQRIGPQPSIALLRALFGDADARVRAAAVYCVGASASPEAGSLAATALKDPQVFVRRRAAEAVVRLGVSSANAFAPVSDVYSLLASEDRFLRYAGRLALERLPRSAWASRALAEDAPLAGIDLMVALIRTASSPADIEPVIERQMSWLKRTDLSTPDRIRLLRALHLAITELPNGLSPERKRQIHDIVYPQFPTSEERLNRELALTLAYCNQPESIYSILGAIPRTDDNQPLQIHYVYCLRAMKPTPPDYCVAAAKTYAEVDLPQECALATGWNVDNKEALVRWFAKAVQWRGGASFTGFLNLMFESALEVFSEDEKQRAYQRLPSFAPPEDLEALRSRARAGWTPPAVLSRQRGVSAVSPLEIFEYQMFDPMTLRANAEGGRKVFDAECASCHRFGGLGKDFGPDLTTLSSRFKKREILDAILWPSKTISDQYESTIIETIENDLINGLILKQDAAGLLIKTADLENPIEVPLAKIKSRRHSRTSIMPEGLLDGYSQGQIADLIAFLLAAPRK